jgi:ketosteroid isomerase-like protein
MSAVEAEVWRVIEEWNSAFAVNDVDRYFSYLDDSVTVMTASSPYRVEGIHDDRAEFEFGLKRGYSRVSYFEEIAPIVRVFGDAAVVTYFNRGYYGPEEGGQMIYLKETNVLTRIDGRWRIVHIHVSK